MADDSRPGLAALTVAKAVCCGGLLVLAAGGFGLGGLAGWFLDGGFWWLVLATVAAAILHLGWRRRHRGLLAAAIEPVCLPVAKRRRAALGLAPTSKLGKI